MSSGSHDEGVTPEADSASPRVEDVVSAAHSSLRRTLLRWAGALILIGVLLRLNVIDVMSIWGRLIYGMLCLGLLLSFVLMPFALSMVERRQAERPLRLVKAGAAGATLLTLLLAIESGARVLSLYDSLVINPGSRFMWPDFYIRANSLVMKDREPGPRRGPRILVLGDSFSEGAGVRREARFSNRLEDLYQSTDPGLEVYNAGLCGMDTQDQADALQRVGDVIDPDAIVIAYVINDADGFGMRTHAEGPPPSRVRSFMVQTLGWYAYYRADVSINHFKSLDLLEQIEAQHADGSPGWKIVNDSLERIADWADERGVPAVLITLPPFESGADAFAPTFDRVIAAAEQRGIRGRNTIGDYGGEGASMAVSGWDSHPGAPAHVIIADQLHGWLGRPWAGESPALEMPLR